MCPVWSCQRQHIAEPARQNSSSHSRQSYVIVTVITTDVGTLGGALGAITVYVAGADNFDCPAAFIAVTYTYNVCPTVAVTDAVVVVAVPEADAVTVVVGVAGAAVSGDVLT